MYNYVIVHYGEIAIKGKNRSLFEKKLVNNIKQNLTNIDYDSINRIYGRIIIELNKKQDIEKIKDKLKKIPGIYHFSFAYSTALDIKEIKDKLLKIAKDYTNNTFSIRAKRSNKGFKYNSQELNEILGELLVKKLKLKVNLDNPEITFFIEITEKLAFILTEKIKGLAGLPVGVSGNLIALISGGIDSPVAAYKMMKRGCNITFVHFQNQKAAEKNKITKLVKVLSAYQPSTTLYIIPFEDIQKEIIKIVQAKYRMIIYRRTMFRIAEKISKEIKAGGFVTGDSLGQVASQTLKNLNVIYHSTTLPVFSPLIGTDKEEIINEAKKISTFNISIQPYPDCCSFLVAEHPETKSNLFTIERIETNLKLSSLIDESIKKANIIKNVQ